MNVLDNMISQLTQARSLMAQAEQSMEQAQSILRSLYRSTAPADAPKLPPKAVTAPSIAKAVKPRADAIIPEERLRGARLRFVEKLTLAECCAQEFRTVGGSKRRVTEKSSLNWCREFSAEIAREQVAAMAPPHTPAPTPTGKKATPSAKPAAPPQIAQPAASCPALARESHHDLAANLRRGKAPWTLANATYTLADGREEFLTEEQILAFARANGIEVQE